MRWFGGRKSKSRVRFRDGRLLTDCAVAVGLGTLFGLVAAAQVHLYGHAVGRDIGMARLIPIYLARWYIWVALTPFIFAAARRWQLGGEQRRGTRVLNAGMLALAAALFALLHSTLSAVVDFALVTGRVPIPLAVTEHVGTFFVSGLVIASAIIAVHHALDYHRRYRNRELRAIHLGAQLAQTRLQLLRMQLRPHFLFNTLNSISSLMHEDIEAADAMLAALGDLLRAALHGDGSEEVPLRQEVELARCYLEIMKLRFGGDLAECIDIAPDTFDALVPNMILQPLVENAVLHGIAARRGGGGRVQLRATRAGGSLLIDILDDGIGLPHDWDERRGVGVGLGNTRSRLRRLYGANHDIEIGNRDEGGVRLAIRIPFHTTAVIALPAA